MFNHDKYQVALLYNVPKAGTGRYFIYAFPNGYTALVIKNMNTFDGYMWHYVIEFCNNSGITFASPDFGGLIRTPGAWLDENEVEEALQSICNLPPAM